jgi:tellurite resistance protein
VKAPTIVTEAVERLCLRFEQNDYNPTPLIDLGVLVANADGKIDDEELEALCDILSPMFHAQLNAELVGYLVTASLKVIGAAGTEPRARLVTEILLDCDAVEEGLMLALAVAFAKGGSLAAAERALLLSIARAADIPESRFDELAKQVQDAVAKKRDSVAPPHS